MIFSKKQLLLSLFLLSVFLSGVFSLSCKALELNNSYPASQGFDINDNNGDEPDPNQDLNQIIAWFYYLIVTISGFSAFYMLVWGGFMWLSSGVSGKKIEAKNKITSALLGLLLILSSFLILRLINPDLTTLNLPSILDF